MGGGVTMNIYLVERIDEAWYDQVEDFVICAPTYFQARLLASKDCGDEGSYVWTHESKITTLGPAAKSIKKGIIIRNYNAG